jgi:hypothetical protein
MGPPCSRIARADAPSTSKRAKPTATSESPRYGWTGLPRTVAASETAGAGWAVPREQGVPATQSASGSRLTKSMSRARAGGTNPTTPISPHRVAHAVRGRLLGTKWYSPSNAAPTDTNMGRRYHKRREIVVSTTGARPRSSRHDGCPPRDHICVQSPRTPSAAKSPKSKPWNGSAR